MMKKILIIVTLLYSMVICSAQNKNNQQVDNKMMNYRTFDVEEYRKITQRNEYGKRYIIRDSGMIVQKEEDFSNGNLIGFREDCHYPDSPYNTVFLYYKNGRIKKSWTTFYYCVIGNITEYDSIGRVVNQRDEDVFYKFDIEALIKKMKKEYNVDLLDIKSIYEVSRFFIKSINQSFYEVYAYRPNTLTQADTYLIDGMTGETLLKSKRGVRLEYGAPYEETMLEEYLHKKGVKGNIK